MRLHEPLLLPFGSVAAGLAIAHWQKFPERNVCLAFAGMSALAIFAYLAHSKRLAFGTCLGALAFAGIALLGFRIAPRPPSLSVPDNVPAIFEGCVVDPALVATDREHLTVELAPGARAQVSLSLRPAELQSGVEFPDLPYGTRVQFQGRVRRPHNYNDPGTFDAVHYLARQQIYWTAAGNATTVRRLPGRCGNRLASGIFAVRSASLNRLDKLYAGDTYANGMMQAVLIGATAKLDRMWTEDYRSTGTFHALVISGTHVAVLAAVFLFFLRICAVPRGVALILTILMAWLYAGVTGWQAPVMRSAAGMSLYGIGRCFFRDGRLLNILAAVALLFVLADPEQLFDPSFQLSFLAVALIGAFVVRALNATSAPLARGLRDLDDTGKDIRVPPKSAQFRIEMRLLARTLTLICGIPAKGARFFIVTTSRCCFYLWEIFVTSFFIQIGLALPMISYFHRMSASGLTANAIVVPVLGAVVPLGFIAIATNSMLLARLCAWLLSVARVTVGIHAKWEPDWRIPTPPFWLATIFALALIVAALRIKSGRWHIVLGWAAAAASLAVIVLHPFAPVVARGKFELSAIDVGQGDSLLAAFPQGTLMLIDAGGIPSFGRAKKPGLDVGEEVVSQYLWTRSIKHLDIIVMTHAHEDHMGGLSAVMRNFHPREFWTGATQDSPEWKTVRDTAERLHIRIRQMQRQGPMSFAGTTLEILAPGPDYAPESIPKNNDSLVMRVRFGSTSFLLTGDMEKQIENQLADLGLLRHDDVLKVGHHGSRTSSTPMFLDLEHPAFGIISVGFDNSYGHPHPLTIDALEERRIGYFRTDEQGLITVVSDGRHLRIETAAPLMRNSPSVAAEPAP
ncbi:MAG TPA: ComEC/Rec2 family competence protein [Bryobacteraceae bacterium]|nr:ComEC/Rec2 family competence protein [Bryobacteraceae bacterium]